MSLYNFLENPSVYNLIGKILSFNNNSVGKYLLSACDLAPNSLILDVGCGTGRYAGLFKGKFFGIDINPDYINYAKNHHHGVFLVMDSANLKLSDNTFDLVFNVGVFHHLSDKQINKTVSEMKRVTKAGGKILIFDAVFPHKTNFIGYFLFKFDRGQFTRTLPELKNLLGQHGFSLAQDNLKGSFPYRLVAFSYHKRL